MKFEIETVYVLEFDFNAYLQSNFMTFTWAHLSIVTFAFLLSIRHDLAD